MQSKNFRNRQKSSKKRPPSYKNTKSYSKPNRKFSDPIEPPKSEPEFAKTKKRIAKKLKNGNFEKTRTVPRISTSGIKFGGKDFLESTGRLGSCSVRSSRAKIRKKSNSKSKKRCKKLKILSKVPSFGKVKIKGGSSPSKKSKNKTSKLSKISTAKSNVAKKGFVNPFSAKEEQISLLN
jgi:hypothetical protein